MENDKLYDCALSYTQNNDYEYRIKFYFDGKINETTLFLNKSDKDKIIRVGNGYAIKLINGKESYNKSSDSDLPYKTDMKIKILFCLNFR